MRLHPRGRPCRHRATRISTLACPAVGPLQPRFRLLGSFAVLFAAVAWALPHATGHLVALGSHESKYERCGDNRSAPSTSSGKRKTTDGRTGKG